jgi:hypothetical protein
VVDEALQAASPEHSEAVERWAPQLLDAAVTVQT